MYGLPDEIKYFTDKITDDKKSNIWNATINIKNTSEFKDISIVKCFLDKDNNIFNLKRFYKFDSTLNKKVHKSVGLIAFKSSILKKVSNLKKTNNEKIEQLNFLNDKQFLLKSIKLKYNFFSINTDTDYKKVKYVFKFNKIQKKISRTYKTK